MDEHENTISVENMLAQRMQAGGKTSTYNQAEFVQRTRLAQKWFYRAMEWDQYRMLDSEQVLAFEDTTGQRHDEASITQCREKMDSARRFQRLQQRSERVTQCFEEKYIRENLLLLYKERAHALRTLRAE